VQAAIDLKDKVVAEVVAGNMTVVCDGVTSDILPGLDDSKVPGFHIEPYGPHPVGNFKVINFSQRVFRIKTIVFNF
jgi:hypothetical protein